MNPIGASAVLSLDAELEQLLDIAPAQRTTWIQTQVHDAKRRALLTCWLAQLDADDWLSRGVESVLRADANGDFLIEKTDAWTPQSFGRYRLLRPIGEGGAAMVWLAERADESSQRVAIKCLKRGLLGQRARERFITEQTLLARLSHPNIVRLLDADVSQDGVPFTVMEWIDGASLTAHAKPLTLDAKLQLFLQLCRAVMFAHRNLVLHRDLKPGNVIVDVTGCVKLLDFGISRLVSDEHATQSLIMTPAYAAPEQLRGDALNTTVDVFGLGAVLFELLTERAPFAGIDRLQNKDLAAGKPSHVAGLNAERAEQLRGDLDAIVQHAMELDPRERFASVDELANDIQRHLRREPIYARPPTFAYIASRFVARNRWRLAATSVLALGVIASTWMVWQSSMDARREAMRAQQSLRFVESLFTNEARDKVLSELPSTAELLERGAARAERELSGDPLGQVQVLAWVGRVYRASDRIRDASNVLMRAKALIEAHQLQRHAIAREVELDLFDANLRGDLKPIAQLREDFASLEKRMHSASGLLEQAPVNPSVSDELRMQHLKVTLLQAGDRYLEADKLAADVIALLQRSPQTAQQQIGEWLLVRSRTASSLFKHADAAEFAQRAIQTLEQAPGTPASLRAEAHNAYALALAWNHDARAEAALYTALELSRSLSRTDNLQTTDVANALGNMQAVVGNYESARENLQFAYDTRVKLLGATHQETLNVLGDIATLNRRAGNLAEAERGYRASLQALTQQMLMQRSDSAKQVLMQRSDSTKPASEMSTGATTADQKPSTVSTDADTTARRAIVLGNLADVLIDLGKLEEALPMANESLVLRRSATGAQSSAASFYYLWRIAAHRGNLEQALQFATAGIADIGENSEPSADLGLLLLMRADCEIQLGRKDAARISLERALNIHLTVLPKDHLRWGQTHLLQADWQLRFVSPQAARPFLQMAEPFLTRNKGLALWYQQKLRAVRAALSASAGL
jgi:eukaryotic-like serine/threonine-protein kinase